MDALGIGVDGVAAGAEVAAAGGVSVEEERSVSIPIRTREGRKGNAEKERKDEIV